MYRYIHVLTSGLAGLGRDDRPRTRTCTWLNQGLDTVCTYIYVLTVQVLTHPGSKCVHTCTYLCMRDQYVAPHVHSCTCTSEEIETEYLRMYCRIIRTCFLPSENTYPFLSVCCTSFSVLHTVPHVSIRVHFHLETISWNSNLCRCHHVDQFSISPSIT